MKIPGLSQHLFPDTDMESWSERYNIKPKEIECIGCKVKFLTTIPVAIKGYRGLCVPEHECGPNYRAAIFVPTDKEEIKYWLNFKYGK